MDVIVARISQPVGRFRTNGNNCGSATEILNTPERVAKVRVLCHNKGKLAVLARRVVNQVCDQKGIDALLLEIATGHWNCVAQDNAASGQEIRSMCSLRLVKVLGARVNISTLELTRRAESGEEWEQARNDKLLSLEPIKEIRAVHKYHRALKCLRRVRLRKR